MNARISKLLRSYARSTGRSIPDVKREWNSTPRDKRGEVRATMEAGLWAKELREWRKAHDLIEKEAADYLQVPYDTLRGWESLRRTPDKYARLELRRLMKLPIKP